MIRSYIILGAPDPEMEMIERTLKEAWVPYAYAMRDGRRVHPGNAYEADGLSAPLPESETVLAVECGGPTVPADAVVVDHHRPGDPGYGRPPTEYLPASSIGQVLDWLGIEPTDEHRLVAAADHCLSAAYRGECPGVDPDALMRWRIESRARFQRRDPADLLAQVEQTRARIRELAVDGVADLTGEPGGALPEAPEAAAREGVAVIARVRERDGRAKLVLLGAAEPDFVRYWMRTQRALGREVYGDPMRGFAGAYL